MATPAEQPPLATTIQPQLPLAVNMPIQPAINSSNETALRSKIRGLAVSSIC